ncbi:hypothetical protein I3842_01G248900 [Carya illinoinensis]|uniref:Phytocyanin domain-containing protein n=1 Tax=Carya illinoinensis TaxID=32201 RepID=A0A922G340_CARIL|nr:hypothetical protein I3842_01G248900 [Carya illinoinensis]
MAHVVGDSIAFNFITNAHDVFQVPKEFYDSCSSSNPIGDTITFGPVNITLSTASTLYYICTLGDRHYLSGQKLSVTVLSTPNGVPPTSTPPPTPTTPATPSPTSGTRADCGPIPGTMSPPDSSSFGVFTNLFISFLSIAIGFLF